MFDSQSHSFVPFNGISNGKHGHSGGSMNSQMYRNVCVKNAYYEPYSGRSKKRIAQKQRGVCLHKGRKFWDL